MFRQPEAPVSPSLGMSARDRAAWDSRSIIGINSL